MRLVAAKRAVSGYRSSDPQEVDHALVGREWFFRAAASVALASCLTTGCSSQTPRCAPPYPKVGSKGLVTLTLTPQHDGLQAEFGGRLWRVQLPASRQLPTSGQAEVVDGKPSRAIRVKTSIGQVLVLSIGSVGCD